MGSSSLQARFPFKCAQKRSKRSSSDVKSTWNSGFDHKDSKIRQRKETNLGFDAADGGESDAADGGEADAADGGEAGTVDGGESSRWRFVIVLLDVVQSGVKLFG